MREYFGFFWDLLIKDWSKGAIIMKVIFLALAIFWTFPDAMLVAPVLYIGFHLLAALTMFLPGFD